MERERLEGKRERLEREEGKVGRGRGGYRILGCRKVGEMGRRSTEEGEEKEKREIGY